MACIADGFDFAVTLMSGGDRMSLSRSGQSNAITLCYAIFTSFWLFVWHRLSSHDFSCILTAASYVQCMGFLVLCIKVHATRSVRGLSSKTLVLYFLYLGFRLTSTSLKNGYIPVDTTGDYMYQLVDGVTLCLVLNLLYCVHKTHSHSYQEEYDTLALGPLVGVCVVLGICVHANFNNSKFFDTVWAISSNFEIVTMVPQLWMMAKMGGKVDNLTAHFVFAITLSNVLSFTWWWWCGKELEKRGPCLLFHVVLGGNMLRLLFSADFLYYYAIAWLGGTQIILPELEKEEM